MVITHHPGDSVKLSAALTRSKAFQDITGVVPDLAASSRVSSRVEVDTGYRLSPFALFFQTGFPSEPGSSLI